MKKIFRRAGLLCLIFVFGIFLLNFNTAIYGFRQLRGQLKIVLNTTDIRKIENNPATPDSVKASLRLIEDIRQFATDSLGLKPSENYTTYYDQKGEPLMWVVTASEPYRLEARKWVFPILGEFSYKGFFEKKLAEKEISSLKSEGYDTRLGEASAWSTLGYLKDPVLSSMLDKKPGDLAALIIHELTHGTLFVKDNLEFNENLADFIGDYGALRFLETRFGKNSPEYEEYNRGKVYGERFSRHIMQGARKLDSLYQTFTPEFRTSDKDSLKFKLIDEIIISMDTLGKKRSTVRKIQLNNAYFVAFKTYQARQNQFEEEFKGRFKHDFRAYMTYLKQKYPSIGL